MRQSAGDIWETTMLYHLNFNMRMYLVMQNGFHHNTRYEAVLDNEPVYGASSFVFEILVLSVRYQT